MAKRIKQIYMIKDKDVVNYEITQTKDIGTQIDWTTVMDSASPMELDLTSIPNLYTCSVYATAPVTVDLINTVNSYASFYGSMLIFTPAVTVIPSIETLRITSGLDDLEVKISVFGE